MIHEETWPEAAKWDQALGQVINEQRAADPESRLAVMSDGGWCSRKNITEWENQGVDALASFVRDLIEEISEDEVERLQGWATVLPAEASISEHNHHQADLVAIYYVDIAQGLLLGLLLVLSAMKFVLVMLWFMHLRFDSPLFSTLFTGGLLLAVALFMVVLATLGSSLV